MCQGKKKGTSTLKSSMVAVLLIKVIPTRVKATDKLKNSCVSCIQQGSTFSTKVVKQLCKQHLQFIPRLTAHLRKATKHVVGNAHYVV